MLNIRNRYSVYASAGDRVNGQLYFWLNADYPSEVEAHAAAARIIEQGERGAKIVEVRTVTTLTKA